MFIYLNTANGIGGFEGNERPILGSRRSRLAFAGALKREIPVEVKDGSATCRVPSRSVCEGSGTLATLYDHTRPERQRRHSP